MGSGIFVAHYLNDRTSLEFQGPLLDGGAEYYGLMWLLFELLGEAQEHKLAKSQLRAIAHQCFSTQDRVKAFIADAVEAGLFGEDETHFWCEEINERIGSVEALLPNKRSRAPSPRKSTRTPDFKYPTEFIEFWNLYPRRDGKMPAYEQFALNLKNGFTAEEMQTAARNYARAQQGKDQQYTLMPSTFLGPSQRWRDYKDAKNNGISNSRPASVARTCPVCGFVEENEYISGCKRCGFWLDDANKPEEVEAWKRDRASGAKKIDLVDLVAKKFAEKEGKDGISPEKLSALLKKGGASQQKSSLAAERIFTNE